MNSKAFNTKTISLDPNEIEKFSKMADDWWNPTGKFKPLHDLNPSRLLVIRKILNEHFNKADDEPLPLKTLPLLDIGCGGGLLSEPMARLGANVTAIDPVEDNIKTAILHAQQTQLNIRYLCTSVEELVKTKKEHFKIILNMEVIEHVAHPDHFITNCLGLLKPGGIMILSTINRTANAYIKAILGAEYVLKWLPKGTHDYKKFLKPEEIKTMIEQHPKMTVLAPSGLSYSILQRKWYVSNDVSVNYILAAQKHIS